MADKICGCGGTTRDTCAAAGRGVAAHVLIFRPLIIENSFEQMSTNIYCCLICKLVFGFINGANSYTSEVCLCCHF
ncbi:hypothetical protein HanIR_Chr11g0507711 [Helianthus annuus]|nr:hypothetical protein HanIR_Chr11g0507711 [Helianthus annuus]